MLAIKLNSFVKAAPRTRIFQIKTSKGQCVVNSDLPPKKVLSKFASETMECNSKDPALLLQSSGPSLNHIPKCVRNSYRFGHGPLLFSAPRFTLNGRHQYAYYSTSATTKESNELSSSGGDKKRRVVPVPTIAESISSGVVFELKKTPGSMVDVDEVVMVLETEKIQVEVLSPYAGMIESIAAKPGDTVDVGSDLFVVIEGEVEPPKPQEQAVKVEEVPRDVKATQEQKIKPQQAEEKKPLPVTSPKVVSGGQAERTDRRVRMTQARKRTAVRLKDSQNTAAMLTTFNDVDMQELMNVRNRYKDRFLERHGVKLGFMSAFAKASAIALMENPIVNAVMDGDDIVYHDYVDISVAVSTPTSLVVPVLRNVECMSFAEIEKAIGDFGTKAKNNKLTLEDMSGGTFTISNGGVFGSLMGTPIINPPQSAILGMHGVNKRPHVVNDKIEIRPMMYIALTYDHRLIDGRDAVISLKRIKALIEDPVSMLLDL